MIVAIMVEDLAVMSSIPFSTYEEKEKIKFAVCD